MILLENITVEAHNCMFVMLFMHWSQSVLVPVVLGVSLGPSEG